ncbi:hypothetical protein M3J09_006089 [Ascochyta lentis]
MPQHSIESLWKPDRRHGRDNDFLMAHKRGDSQKSHDPFINPSIMGSSAAMP